MMNHIYSSSIKGLSVLSLSIWLTACGGGAESTSSTATPAPVATQSPAPSPVVTSGNTTATEIKVTATPTDVSLPNTLSNTYAAKSAELGFYAQLNMLRELMGLGALKQNTKLDLAAQNHANYLIQNFASFSTPGKGFGDIDPNTKNLYAHSETAGIAGFTGILPLERYVATGGSKTDYTVVGEVSIMPGEIANTTDWHHYGTQALDDLMNTVYHREQLIQDNITEIGVDIQKGMIVSNILKPSSQSLKRLEDLMAFPGHNSVMPYPYWQAGIEAPNPVPEIANGTAIGGPVSLSTASGTKLKATSFELYDVSGQKNVTGKIIDKTSDKVNSNALLGNTAYFIPLSKLDLNKQYSVRFNGIMTDSKNNMYDVKAEWDFRTPLPVINYSTALNKSFEVKAGGSLTLFAHVPSGMAQFSYTCTQNKVCDTAFLKNTNNFKVQGNDALEISIPKDAKFAAAEQLIVYIEDQNYPEIPKKTIYIKLG